LATACVAYGFVIGLKRNPSVRAHPVDHQPDGSRKVLRRDRTEPSVLLPERWRSPARNSASAFGEVLGPRRVKQIDGQVSTDVKPMFMAADTLPFQTAVAFVFRRLLKSPSRFRHAVKEAPADALCEGHWVGTEGSGLRPGTSRASSTISNRINLRSYQSVCLSGIRQFRRGSTPRQVICPDFPGRNLDSIPPLEP
jgi:hypothetical protein